MALTIGTSPAVATVFGGASATTASFTSPAGGLLVAGLATLDVAASGLSGGGLTWTRRVQRTTSGWVEIWTAPSPTAQSMTVTATLAGTGSAALKLWPVSGQHLSPIGTTGTGSTTTNNATITGYTSTGDGSRGFVVALDAALGDTPSSTDTAVAGIIGGFMPYLMATKAANSGPSGSTVQFNLDAGGTDPAGWQWVAFEVLAAPEQTRGRPLWAGQAVNRAANF